MRWTWLRALLLGIILGPFPPDVDAADAEVVEVDASSPRGAGYAVRGRNFYVWDEDAREAADWGVDLFVASGPGPGVEPWRSLAQRNAALPALLTSEHEADLEAWVKGSPDASRAQALGFLLCLLPGLDRTCLVSAWATSPDEELRLALARALAAPFDAVAVPGALEALRKDESPAVRRLARAAAASRGLLFA